mgnify:CR=1 FL=1
MHIMNESKLIIYGAYGYSGELMVREAIKQGIKPVVAGRIAEKLLPIANELGLEYRAFSVKDAAGYLQDVTVLLNCAGPFSATAGFGKGMSLTKGTLFGYYRRDRCF